MLANFSSEPMERSEAAPAPESKSLAEIRAAREERSRQRKLERRKERKSKFINNFMPAVAMVVLICTVSYVNSLQFGLVVSYNDQTIATVENADVFEEANSIINNKIINKSLDALEDEPKYSVAVIGNNSSFQNSAELSRTILEKDNVLEDEICGVFVDGDFIGAVADEDTARSVLESLLDEQIKKNASMGEVIGADFNSSVSLQTGLYAKSSIVNADTLKERLVENIDLSYKIMVSEKQNVKIKYKTEYKVDESKPSGYEQVTTKGELGEGYTVNLVTYVDGVKVSSERDKVVATTKPVNEVVTVSADNAHAMEASSSDTDSENVKAENTKNSDTDTSSDKEIAAKAADTDTEAETLNTDKDVNASQFVWPTPTLYSITNDFGYQDEKLHKGIDISGGSAEGQPIVAAASGYVAEVVFDYGTENYGCYVIIDHGNGYQTMYAQCSDIYVSAGSQVEQGETIAAVGATGNSTGPHLHFEIRENGEYVNPINYLY